MSSTFAPQEALDYAREMVKGMPLDRVWPVIAQDASNYIWVAAPWRWTIGVLSPIPIIAGQQEFNVVNPPSDFLRLERCYVSDASTLRPINPVSALPSGSTLTRLPTTVTISAITASTPETIRFDSLYPALGGKTVNFWAWYKKTAPVLAEDLTTPGALIMDDDYFQIFREWVLYYAYRYSDDQRSGAATVTVNAQGDHQLAYSGQLAVAHAALEELRKQELVLFEFPQAPLDQKSH